MSFKIDAIIPCAGRNERMNTKLPKALLKINKESVINNQIRSLSNYIRNFFIIINENKDEKNKFLKRIDKKYHKKLFFIKSKPGSGDGMALLDGLLHINNNYNYTGNIFVCWGDIYFENKKIIQLFKNYYNNKILISSILIPLKYKKNPYVAFLIDKKNKINNVLFQRRNQFVDYGYQDLGFFIINNKKIMNILKYMKKNIKKNHELNFLDSVKILYKKKFYVKPFFLNFDPKTYSFNKLNELKSLRYYVKK